MHTPVLLNETIQGLDFKESDVLLDATLGLGGHSMEACKIFPRIKIIGLDLNNATRLAAEDLLQNAGCNIETVSSNFRDLDKALLGRGIEKADKYIFDLGYSSVELENSGRGFSFQKDEPLLMTYKDEIGEQDLTAEEIVNSWQEENLEAIIAGYGEERYAGKIARAIALARKQKRITTTFELIEIIRSATSISYQKQKIHFATKTFQALRIAVNDEIEALKEGLAKAFHKLNRKGRIAVISFHSGEDRIVKNYFRELDKTGQAKIINKKPITATLEEIKNNRRARSAKLRILEKND
jgi:16S rRNA (cytosine1402-N4)-methyltransferase